MPRLTTENYLHIHHRLRRLWLHDPSLFAELTPNEQWHLHDFFAPDRDMSDDQLIVRRRSMTALRPSLPQQAGRALAKFWSTTAARSLKQVRNAKTPPVTAWRRKLQDRYLRMRTVVRPEIDTQKLARAFLGLSLQRAKEQKIKFRGVPPSVQDERRSRP